MLDRRDQKAGPAGAQKKSAQTRLTPDQMTLVITQALREGLPGHDVSRSADAPDHVRVTERATGRETVQLDIGLLLAEIYGAALNEAQIAERIADFVHMAHASVTEAPLDPAAVFPALRHSEFIETFGQDGATRAGPGDCGVIVLQKTGARVSCVSRTQMELAGISEEQLWARAEDNLQSQLREIELSEISPGLYCLALVELDWLGNTLMLVPQLLAQALAEAGMQDGLFAAPSRGAVVFADRSDPQALDKLAGVMAEQLAGPHPQSEMVFALAPDQKSLLPRFSFAHGTLRALS